MRKLLGRLTLQPTIWQTHAGTQLHYCKTLPLQLIHTSAHTDGGNCYRYQKSNDSKNVNVKGGSAAVGGQAH